MFKLRPKAHSHQIQQGHTSLVGPELCCAGRAQPPWRLATVHEAAAQRQQGQQARRAPSAPHGWKLVALQ